MCAAARAINAWCSLSYLSYVCVVHVYIRTCSVLHGALYVMLSLAREVEGGGE